MKIPTIECSRVRACKWKGRPEDLVSVKNKKDSFKHGLVISDLICPKCGCKTTYDIEQ